MRKIFIAAALAAGVLAFSSCGGGGKTSSKDSADVQMAPTDAKSYEITDGQLLSNTGKPILVDFYADWCMPCQKMKPVFDSLKNVYGENIDFLSMDVDKHGELAGKYRVEAIPCLVFIAPDGTELYRLVGYQNGETIAEAINRYLQ